MGTVSVQMQMRDILDDIYIETQGVIKQSMAEVGMDTVKYLRRISPKQQGGERSGRYARGWFYSYEGTGYIFNRTDWQLTHLLEDGHRVFNRFGGPFGQYGGVKHILLAEERAGQELPMRISRGLK